MITVIAEHSVDLTLLPEKANVLDLGCRGFLFTNEMRKLKHMVVAVDLDNLNDGFYLKKAVIGEGNAAIGVPIERSPDPQATRIGSGISGNRGFKFDFEWVETTTIKKLTDSYCPNSYWDIIKMDIEGSEYEVIMSLTEPPAKQLSIEFHLHTGVYDIQAVRRMEAKLHSLGYYFASHGMTSQHGMGKNYWDSLFILK